MLSSLQNIQKDKHIFSMIYAPLVLLFKNKHRECIFQLKEDASNMFLLS